MNTLIQKINRKDVRSGITWCKANNVEIYRDSIGKFVIEAEFNLAYDLQIINRYKEKYKENWEIMYELAKSDKLYKATSSSSASSSKMYKPKCKASEDFLKKYKKQ